MIRINTDERGNAFIVVILAMALVGGGAALFLVQGDSTGNVTGPEVSVNDIGANDATSTNADTSAVSKVNKRPVFVTPIAHASMMLRWDNTVMYTDPVGEPNEYADLPIPNVILLTDTDGDHLSIETLEAVTGDTTRIIAPDAVLAELPPDLARKTETLANGETTEILGFTLAAVAMYNLPEQGVEIRHEKGRGNGYLIDDGDYRVYIAGDTADIPEMRELENIDLAFVPMNPPYTMDIERAAAGVLAFAPSIVMPYHFRTPEGFSDVTRFQELVAAENVDISVELLDWYPNTEEDGV